MARTALVYDSFLFPYIAAKLADGFDRVLYYVPMEDAFRASKKMLWGSGLPGVERVHDFFSHLDESDVVVFPDIGAGDLQAWLRSKGHAVWGSAQAEALELDRTRMKRLMHANGMAIHPTWLITGMDDLRTHLEDADNDDQYVKVSEWRGDFETHHHINWWLSEPWFKRVDHSLGPMRERIELVVESSIDGVEVGYDGFTIDGQFPQTAMIGYEQKDTGYIGRVCTPTTIPRVIQEVNDDLGPALTQLECRSFFSTELRVTERGEGFLIDPTLRAPSPPVEAMLELFTNWSDVIAAGANGQVVEPEPAAAYCAAVILRSSRAEDDFLALRFPPWARPFIKLHGHAIVDGVDYVVCLGMDVIGAAVGVGDTMDAACEQAMEAAKSIEAEEIEFAEDAFDQITETIQTGRDHGIPWEA